MSFDVEKAGAKARELVGKVMERVRVDGHELTRSRTELMPAFLQWNLWGRWKDVKNWDPKPIGALIIYIFVVVLSFQRIYVAIRAPILDRQRKELTEAFMEALIPEPSRSNVRKLKKNVWRRMTLKVLSSKSSLKDLLEHIHDPSYVGEDAWGDNDDPLRQNLKQIIDSDCEVERESKE